MTSIIAARSRDNCHQTKPYLRDGNHPHRQGGGPPQTSKSIKLELILSPKFYNYKMAVTGHILRGLPYYILRSLESKAYLIVSSGDRQKNHTNDKLLTYLVSGYLHHGSFVYRGIKTVLYSATPLVSRNSYSYLLCSAFRHPGRNTEIANNFKWL